ncbi:MAG: hypothetical protein FWF60_07090 [Oscillospiraceae bacterium]|nr:hypothetical protein [Oscillospiraceae bacterium]
MKKTAALLLALALLLACLTVPAGASFESEYKSYKGEWAGGGRSPIKMKLEGDTLTFDYSPVFYFSKKFGLAEEDKARIIAECVAGFRRWAGVYEINGRELTVVVDVHPSEAGSLLASNVRVIPDNSLIPNAMVPGCLLWWPSSPFLAMYRPMDDPRRRNFESTAMHEFGHVLGLFDAYGYRSHFYGVPFLADLADRLLPEAPPDRAPRDSVMYSGRDIRPKEIEMLLWAWKHRRLQLYTKSVLTWLGAEVSPAFSE